MRISPVLFGKVLYSGAMCGGAAYLVSSAAEKMGASAMTVMILSAAAGGVVYLGLLTVFALTAGSSTIVTFSEKA